MPTIPLDYLLVRAWNWFVETGLDLTLLTILAFLVPRTGRLAMRFVEHRVADEHEDESKAHLAFAGVAIYIAQMIAYFLVFVFMLQQLGFSLASAAIPATAASAAIGLGAQSIIADFLAGFFVLSEKQYGVGDWVRFEGGATTVEGTVIQITMRATRIRTLAEETVIIPNSKAGVSINNSNYWSSAVVKMPVPLLGSDSIREAIERATRATKRAIEAPDVRENILGELKVHESVGINPPTTVGTPWTVDLRFVVQVLPGMQWAVERAIRTSIIDEFWQEYGSAPTVSGAVAPELEYATHEDDPTALFDAAAHPHHTTPARAERKPDDYVGASAKDAASDAEQSPATEALGAQGADTVAGTKALETSSATAILPAASGGATPPAFDAQDPRRGELADLDPAANQSAGKPGAGAEDDTDADADKDGEELHGYKKWLTFGGRMRVSTAWLLLGVIAVMLLKGFTVETSEEWRESKVEQSSVSSTATTPAEIAPTTNPEFTEPATPTATAPTQTDTTQPSDTPTPEPDEETTPTTPASSGDDSGWQEETTPTGTAEPTAQ